MATLADAIAHRLATSPLDQMLKDLAFGERFSATLQPKIVCMHNWLKDEVAASIEGWSEAAVEPGWKPRNHASFASKYLHFHRPNAFPIMDTFAKGGLRCARVGGSFNSYDDFCRGVVRYVENIEEGWTPRSIDRHLVCRGRAHADRTVAQCPKCSKVRMKRKEITVTV